MSLQLTRVLGYESSNTEAFLYLSGIIRATILTQVFTIDPFFRA